MLLTMVCVIFRMQSVAKLQLP